MGQVGTDDLQGGVRTMVSHHRPQCEVLNRSQTLKRPESRPNAMGLVATDDLQGGVRTTVSHHRPRCKIPNRSQALKHPGLRPKLSAAVARPSGRKTASQGRSFLRPANRPLWWPANFLLVWLQLRFLRFDPHRRSSMSIGNLLELLSRLLLLPLSPLLHLLQLPQRRWPVPTRDGEIMATDPQPVMVAAVEARDAVVAVGVAKGEHLRASQLCKAGTAGFIPTALL